MLVIVKTGFMEPTRETISLFIMSVLGGLALTNSITQLQMSLSEKSAQGSPVPIYSLLFFLVFVSVWLRFIPGSLAFIRRIERWAGITVRTWAVDIFVVTTECMIIVFMAPASVNQPEQFIVALLGLLLLDASWMASMLPAMKKKIMPKSAQWVWMWLNIPSASLLVFLLIMHWKYHEILSLTSTGSVLVISSVFIVCAVIDIIKSSPDWFGEPGYQELSRQQRNTHERFMKEALEEAEKSLKNGGVPIGSVLVQEGEIISRGHNCRVQMNDPTAHAEMVCIRNAGRRQNYRGVTLYSTLMPCCMCAGTIVQFSIERVVVGESRNFNGARSFLEENGVIVIDLNVAECHQMLKRFIENNSLIWNEDIGRS
jgi:creatinine deaminase